MNIMNITLKSRLKIPLVFLTFTFSIVLSFPKREISLDKYMKRCYFFIYLVEGGTQVVVGVHQVPHLHLEAE